MENESKTLTEKQYIILLICSCIMIVGGRLIAQAMSPLFASYNYGQMTDFFVEIITCVIWSVMIIGTTILVYRREKVNITFNIRTRGRELENKNLFAVIIVVVAAIFIISAQIGFQVKPFYDMGVKFTGYEFMANIGGILRNCIKCVWMIIIMECAQAIGEAHCSKPYIPWGGIALMCTIGIYDIVCGMTTLVITYLLMNIVFGVIYMLTNKSVSKTYLSILLIYIF